MDFGEAHAVSCYRLAGGSPAPPLATFFEALDANGDWSSTLSRVNCRLANRHRSRRGTCWQSWPGPIEIDELPRYFGSCRGAACCARAPAGAPPGWCLGLAIYP